MNKPIDQSEFKTPDVTTGGLPSSTKVYTAPEAAPDIGVPLNASLPLAELKQCIFLAPTYHVRAAA